MHTEKISDGRSLPKVENRIAVDDIVFPASHERAGEIIVEAGHRIGKAVAELICSSGVKSVQVMDVPKFPYLLNSMAEDNTSSHEEALLRIYQRLRPGNPPALEKAKQLFHEKFFDVNRYRLGRVGRFRVNRKLGLTVPEDEMALRPEDIIASIKYLIDLLIQTEQLGSMTLTTWATDVYEPSTNWLAKNFARVSSSFAVPFKSE